MKLILFEASTHDWEAIELMRDKLNAFLADNFKDVIKTVELVVGIFLVVFAYIAA